MKVKTIFRVYGFPTPSQEYYFGDHSPRFVFVDHIELDENFKRTAKSLILEKIEEGDIDSRFLFGKWEALIMDNKFREAVPLGSVFL